MLSICPDANKKPMLRRLNSYVRNNIKWPDGSFDSENQSRRVFMGLVKCALNTAVTTGGCRRVTLCSSTK